MDYGALCLIPVTVVIVVAILSKRSLEALFCGVLIGCIIVAKSGFFSYITTTFYDVIGENGYYICLFGFLGAFIKMFEVSGAALGFSVVGERLSKTKKDL